MKKLLNLVFIAILGVCNLYAQGVDLKREGTTVSSGTDSVCWEGNTMCKNLVLKLEYYLKMQSKMVLLIKKLDY